MDAITEFSKSIIAEFRPERTGAESVWNRSFDEPDRIPKYLAEPLYDRIWDSVVVRDTTLKCLNRRYMFGASEVWLTVDGGMRQSERLIAYVEVPDHVIDDAKLAASVSDAQATVHGVVGTTFLIEESSVKTDVTIGSKEPINRTEVRVKGEQRELNL